MLAEFMRYVRGPVAVCQDRIDEADKIIDILNEMVEDHKYDIKQLQKEIMKAIDMREKLYKTELIEVHDTLLSVLYKDLYDFNVSKVDFETKKTAVLVIEELANMEAAFLELKRRYATSSTDRIKMLQGDLHRIEQRNRLGDTLNTKNEEPVNPLLSIMPLAPMRALKLE